MRRIPPPSTDDISSYGPIKTQPREDETRQHMSSVATSLQDHPGEWRRLRNEPKEKQDSAWCGSDATSRVDLAKFILHVAPLDYLEAHALAKLSIKTLKKRRVGALRRYCTEILALQQQDHPGGESLRLLATFIVRVAPVDYFEKNNWEDMGATFLQKHINRELYEERHGRRQGGARVYEVVLAHIEKIFDIVDYQNQPAPCTSSEVDSFKQQIEDLNKKIKERDEEDVSKKIDESKEIDEYRDKVIELEEYLKKSRTVMTGLVLSINRILIDFNATDFRGGIDLLTNDWYKRVTGDTIDITDFLANDTITNLDTSNMKFTLESDNVKYTDITKMIPVRKEETDEEATAIAPPRAGLTPL